MTTIPIPGGTATFRSKTELTARGRRSTQAILMGLDPVRVQAIMQADPAALARLGLTVRERETILSLQDAAIVAWLKSWTLDIPIPADSTEAGDLPTDLYDPIAAEAMRLQAEVAGYTDSDGNVVDPFSVGAVEDPNSPTDASAASGTRSKAGAARRAPSDRKKPAGGTSTATARRSPASRTSSTSTSRGKRSSG